MEAVPEKILHPPSLLVPLPLLPIPPSMKAQQRRIIRNVIIVSISFLLLFTSFNSIANLQSSLHPSNGLGVWGMLAIYGSLIISSLFLPTFIIRKISAKWTIVLSMTGYTFYMAAQFYPRFSTIIPTAIVLGICAAPLWASKCFYLTHIAGKYANLSKDSSLTKSQPEVVIVHFFGIFFCLFQTSSIWGNLISSLILSSGSGSENSSTILENETWFKTDLKCGADFCPMDIPASTATGEDYGEDLKLKVDIFCGICLGIAFLSVAFATFFLDSLEMYGEKERQSSKDLEESGSGYRLLVSTFRQMKHPYQMLLVPLTIFSGLQQSFFWADFTQAYITCSWGVEHVGYVCICYGIVDSVLSLTFAGPVIKRVGRGPVFLAGAVIKIVVISMFFTWRPSAEDKWVFFVIAGLWGAADAVWSCQINAFYGYIFPENEEAAFSNYRIWESIGFVIGYGNSIALCTRPKLWVLTTFLIVGVSCFFVIEFLEKRKAKKGIKV